MSLLALVAAASFIVATIAVVDLATADEYPTTAPSTRPALAGQSHQIQSVAFPSRLLRVEDARSEDGTPIVTYPRQDWKCMTWKFESADDGVRLINYFTHKTFGGASGAAGDDHELLTQHPAGADARGDEELRFIRVGNDEQFWIEHAATGRFLTANPDGSVTLESRSDQDAQKWKLLDRPAHFSG
jgi:hypothetical protein